MPGMNGLELLVISQHGHEGLQYLEGLFCNERGEPIPELLDQTCYQCMSRYFTHRETPVQFCPGCGGWERPPMETLAAMLEWASSQSFDYLEHGPNGAYAVRVDGGWWLRMAPEARLIQQDPLVHDVVVLRAPRTRS
jgi:hypothetical protein